MPLPISTRSKLSTMTTLTDNTALIIIDVQEGLDHPKLGKRNNPGAEQNMARLLADWRKNKRPIFHIQHMSTEPESTLRPELPGNAIKQIVAPQGDEPVIQKSVNNAFVGTNLEERLRSANIQSLVIIGLTTNHCVSTTVRMAGDLGFDATIVRDATAAHPVKGNDGVHYTGETIHATALASLQDEFATVLNTDDVLNNG